MDILDGYSRLLVHWSLKLTILDDTMTLTVQEALEGLSHRRPGDPKIVHDNGNQFLSAEWRRFVEGAGVTDIRTRVAHPQSNGRLERLHRTHREEALTEEDLVDYYRGDPAARLAEREQKLIQALETRGEYWQAYGNVKELHGNQKLHPVT